MSDRRLAAIFFIPNEKEKLPLDKLLEKAQATNIVTAPPTPIEPWTKVRCKWAGFTDCLASLHELVYYQVLDISFRESQFLRLLPPEVDQIPLSNCSLPLEADPTLPLALTFKQACETLKPEVAFIVTHLDQAELDQIIDYEWMAIAKDASALADQGFGLLYLNEEVSQNWIYHPLRDERDKLPVDCGRLVFASKGNMRWF